MGIALGKINLTQKSPTLRFYLREVPEQAKLIYGEQKSEKYLPFCKNGNWLGRDITDILDLIKEIGCKGVHTCEDYTFNICAFQCMESLL